MKKETLYKNLVDFSNGDDDFIKEITKVFIKDTSADIELLVSYKKQKSKKEIILLAHKLIPRLDIFGVVDALEIAKRIDNTDASNDEVEFYNDIDLLVLICKDVIFELKKI